MADADRTIGHFKTAPSLKLKVMKHGRDPVLKKARHSVFIHDEKSGRKELVMTSVKHDATGEQLKTALERGVGDKFHKAGGVKWHHEES